MSILFARTAAAALLLACVPELGAAQLPASVTGRVTGSLGRPVSGAPVRIPALNVGTTTGGDGTYRLLVPGARLTATETAYDLTVSAPGYQSGALQLRLRAGVDATGHFSLTPITEGPDVDAPIGVQIRFLLDEARTDFRSLRGEVLRAVPGDSAWRSTFSVNAGQGALQQLGAAFTYASALSRSAPPGSPSDVARDWTNYGQWIGAALPGWTRRAGTTSEGAETIAWWECASTASGRAVSLSNEVVNGGERRLMLRIARTPGTMCLDSQPVLSPTTGAGGSPTVPPAESAPLSAHIRYLVALSADTFRTIRGVPRRTGGWESRHLVPSGFSDGYRVAETLIAVHPEGGAVLYVAPLGAYRGGVGADTARLRMSAEFRAALPGWASETTPDALLWHECGGSAPRGHRVSLEETREAGNVFFALAVLAFPQRACGSAPASAGRSPGSAPAEAPASSPRPGPSSPEFYRDEEPAGGFRGVPSGYRVPTPPRTQLSAADQGRLASLRQTLEAELDSASSGAAVRLAVNRFLLQLPVSIRDEEMIEQIRSLFEADFMSGFYAIRGAADFRAMIPAIPQRYVDCVRRRMIWANGAQAGLSQAEPVCSAR